MSLVLSILLLAVAAICAFIGCACLALSQPRNWRTVMGKGQAHQATRPTGWGLVGLSLIFCVARDGGSFAALLWPLLLAGAAFLVAMVLTYRSRWLKPVSWPFSLHVLD